MAIEDFPCRICDARLLEPVPGFESLPRVTSDCVPYASGGELTLCTGCGAVQKLPNDSWFHTIGDIYGKYAVYHQSGGVEQAVFDAGRGTMRPRSAVMIERLFFSGLAPTSGRMLDIGCGSGGTLRALSNRGARELYGLELDERNLKHLTSIPGFRRLFTGDLSDLPETFDLITLVHALEHFPDPRATLQKVCSKLAPGGRIFIEVPNAGVNPFDHVVADHLMHFTPDSLADLCTRAGVTVERIATDWVSKEISLIGVPQDVKVSTVAGTSHGPDQHVFRSMAWLETLVQSATIAAEKPGLFGLFGTSIAATWLFPILEDRISFFVDEDSSRVGRDYLECPVLKPDQVPAGAIVYLALPPAAAQSIFERLRTLRVYLHLPPAF